MWRPQSSFAGPLSSCESHNVGLPNLGHRALNCGPQGAAQQVFHRGNQIWTTTSSHPLSKPGIPQTSPAFWRKKWKTWSLIHVCTHVCRDHVHTHVCRDHVFTHVCGDHVCTHECRDQILPPTVVPWSLSILFFREDLSLVWSSSSRRTDLATELQGTQHSWAL